MMKLCNLLGLINVMLPLMTSGYEFVDLDGDNDKDFVVAFSFSEMRIVWFDNDGSEFFTEQDIALRTWNILEKSLIV